MATATAVSIENAEDFQFCAADHFSSSVAASATSVKVGDGASLIMNEYSCFGKEEFCK